MSECAMQGEQRKVMPLVQRVFEHVTHGYR